MKNILSIIIWFLPVNMLTAQVPLIKDSVFTIDPLDKDWVSCEVRTQSGALFQKGFLYKGRKMGVWRTWNAYQKVSTIEEYRNGLLHGVRYEIGPNGYLESESNYSHGKPDGKKIKWQYGTIVILEENYKNGLLNGERKLFYENGHPQEEAMYKDGKRDGVSKWFYDTGVISIQYTYKNGVLDGPATTYSRTGKLQTEGSYLNDLEQGEWKEYDENGEVIRVVRYDKGREVK